MTYTLDSSPLECFFFSIHGLFPPPKWLWSAETFSIFCPNSHPCLPFFLLVSNEVPEHPCVSPVSNHVYERRLIEKYIAENGTDPVNNQPLSEEQLIDIKGEESQWLVHFPNVRYCGCGVSGICYGLRSLGGIPTTWFLADGKAFYLRSKSTMRHSHQISMVSQWCQN